jgi:hypothetical protein
VTSLSCNTAFKSRNGSSPNLVGYLGIVNCKDTTANAINLEHSLKVGILQGSKCFVQVMHLQCTLYLSLGEQPHIVCNSLNKIILPIRLLGVVDVQPTCMHIKDHTRETKFLPMFNECCPPLAIISHLI